MTVLTYTDILVITWGFSCLIMKTNRSRDLSDARAPQILTHITLSIFKWKVQIQDDHVSKKPEYILKLILILFLINNSHSVKNI